LGFQDLLQKIINISSEDMQSALAEQIAVILLALKVCLRFCLHHQTQIRLLISLNQIRAIHHLLATSAEATLTHENNHGSVLCFFRLWASLF
jgi:hypothetical protein